MDWLKDKKNQPIIAVVAAVVIVLVGVLLFKMMAGGGSPAPEAGMPNGPGSMPGSAGPGAMTPPGAPGAPSPGGPTAGPSAGPTPGGPGAPGPSPAPGGPSAAAPGGAPSSPSAAPGSPANAGAKPGGKNAAAAASPMETSRTDPFLPVGYKPPKRGRKPTPPVSDLPLGALFATSAIIKPPPPVEAAQPARRMAGLLLNDRVYAMIETGGKTEIVQPGQTLQDGLASVVRIEKDKVVLKTTGKPSRYLTVRMAAAPVQDTTAGVDQSPAGPMNPYGPGGGTMGPMMMPPMPGGGVRAPGGGQRTRGTRRTRSNTPM